MQPLDLTNCDREPIHIPGSIQPHGILFVIDLNSEVVLQAAGDTAGSLATQHPPLGRPLHDLLGVGLEVLTRSAGVGLESKPRYLGTISGPASSASVDVLAHMRDDVAVLELESGLADRPLAARLLAEIGAAIAAIDAAPELLSTCQAAAREVRRLTDFDRVMIYRFLEDGSGSVVAEHHVDALPSFLNHRYPASDIPRQARELYVHGVRHGSMRQPAAVEVTATGGQTDGPEPHRRA